jgi:catalase (peroxidase I)
LILAGELSRGENNGLQDISNYLQGLATQYKVGVADMIVFAGSHAVVTCPGGPKIKTYVGRKDSTTPAPDGLLPDVNAPAADLFKLFVNKGFDAVDLAALLGESQRLPAVGENMLISSRRSLNLKSIQLRHFARQGGSSSRLNARYLGREVL